MMETVGVVLRPVIIKRKGEFVPKENLGRVFSCHRKPFDASVSSTPPPVSRAVNCLDPL